MGGRRAHRRRLSRHALDRDARGVRQEGRRVRRVVREREGGRRGGGGSLRRGRARAVHHEARGRERGGRPAVHRRLHGRGGRPGGAGRRRPRHVLVAERAGLAPLRPRGAHPHARSRRLRRGAALHARGLRAVRALRRAGVHPLHGARVAHEDAGGARSARPGSAQALREGRVGVGHVARLRQTAPPRPAGARRGAARVGRDVPLQRGRAPRRRRGRRVRGRRVPACGRGAAGRVGFQAGLHLAAARRGAARLRRER